MVPVQLIGGASVQYRMVSMSRRYCRSSLLSSDSSPACLEMTSQRNLFLAEEHSCVHLAQQDEVCLEEQKLPTTSCEHRTHHAS
jgi:hypothetical protein